MLLRTSVLLIEDECIIALTLQDELEAAGYEVMGPFTTCAAALDALSRRTPDTAILDTALKDGTCHKVAEELNRRGVPFIVYSGYRRSANQSIELQDAIWIEKPALSTAVLKALTKAAPFATRTLAE